MSTDGEIRFELEPFATCIVSHRWKTYGLDQNVILEKKLEKFCYDFALKTQWDLKELLRFPQKRNSAETSPEDEANYKKK